MDTSVSFFLLRWLVYICDCNVNNFKETYKYEATMSKFIRVISKSQNYKQ